MKIRLTGFVPHGSLAARSAGALIGLIVIGFGQPAAAQESSLRPRFSFAGFGTLGVVYSSEKQADYMSDYFRAEGPGFTRTVDPAMDSRLAGQMTVDFGSKLAATVQVMVEQRANREYEPALEWANLSYAFTSNLRIRAGRFVGPAFLVTESRKVTYANPWIRPPVEMYSMAPVHTWDGLEATYRRHIGDWTTVIGAAAGGQEAEAPMGGVVEGNDFANINVTAERGGLTARVSYGVGKLSYEEAKPLWDAFRAFGPEGDAIAERYGNDNSPLDVFGAALTYQGTGAFGTAEFGYINLHSALGEKLGGYLTTGYHIGRFTPYVTYSRLEHLSETSTPGLPLENLPPEQVEIAAGMNAFLNDFLAMSPTQQTVSIGGRWDPRPGIAVSAEVSLVDLLGTSMGMFTNVQPGFRPGGAARMMSVATSFVF